MPVNSRCNLLNRGRSVQIEDAPEYDPNVVLTAELVRSYLERGIEKVA